MRSNRSRRALFPSFTLRTGLPLRTSLSRISLVAFRPLGPGLSRDAGESLRPLGPGLSLWALGPRGTSVALLTLFSLGALRACRSTLSLRPLRAGCPGFTLRPLGAGISFRPLFPRLPLDSLGALLTLWANLALGPYGALRPHRPFRARWALDSKNDGSVHLRVKSTILRKCRVQISHR